MKSDKSLPFESATGTKIGNFEMLDHQEIAYAETQLQRTLYRSVVDHWKVFRHENNVDAGWLAVRLNEPEGKVLSMLHSYAFTIEDAAMLLAAMSAHVEMTAVATPHPKVSFGAFSPDLLGPNA